MCAFVGVLLKLSHDWFVFTAVSGERAATIFRKVQEK